MRIFLAFTCLSCAVLSAQTVTGAITSNGKAYKATAACAYEEPEPFGEKKNRTVVLIWTDGKPLTGPCNEYNFELQSRAQGGSPNPYFKAHLTGPGMSWENGVMGAGRAPISFSYSGDSPTVKFEPAAQPNNGSLTGRFLTLKPFQMGGSPTVEMNIQVAGVKIDRGDAVTDEITGAEAAKSPASQAALRFLNALAKGDPKAVRPLIVEAERAKFDADIASADGKQILAMMSTMAKSTLAVPVSSVSTKGPLTVVKMEKKTANGKETSTFTLIQENGEYRITRKR